ncbi:holo-ACP synthase [Brachybacterium hainanense]|uniref:Holo-[acyl-carrier-protein] synthase n=1 Tax=Brachybacterium hainanense TaxID=1541174 RepID=A0ABV6R7U6_9MICO
MNGVSEARSPQAAPVPSPGRGRPRAFAPSGRAQLAGVGIDVVDVPRLTAMFARTPALRDRLLTPSERGLSDASRAARVAAKEAVGKALGAPGDYSWHDVTVERTVDRRPYLVLSGAALEAAEQLGVAHLHLSLSHDGDIATAIVVAERGAPAADDASIDRGER